MKETIDSYPPDRFRQDLAALPRQLTEAGWRRWGNDVLSFFGLNRSIQEYPLADALAIEKKRERLDQLRATAPEREVGATELAFAERLQEAISQFPYREDAGTPQRIRKIQKINCVGASLVGSALLSELGILHAVVNIPTHALLFVATSDRRIWWIDMINPLYTFEVIDRDVRGASPAAGGIPHVAAIRNLLAIPGQPGLLFDAKSTQLRHTIRDISGCSSKRIAVFHPRNGLRALILDALAHSAYSEKDTDEAISLCREAISAEPHLLSSHHCLGKALATATRHAEAEIPFRQAIDLDPLWYNPMIDLADTLLALDKREEAASYYRQFLDHAHPWRDHHRIAQAKAALKKLER